MSHPVPPPEPPPIVQTLQPKVFHPDTLTPAYPSTTQSVTASPQTSSAFPKSFAPEPFQPSAATSAELLGSSISIGHHVEQVETKNSAVAPSRPIQPLRVSDISTNNTLAKLKKIIASEKNKGQTLPRLSSSLNNVLKSRAQPVEFNFQAPVVQNQPETLPTPAEDQREPLLEPPPASIPYRLPNTPQLPNQPAPAPVLPATPQPESQPSEQSPAPSPPQVTERIVELTSDRQEYDQQRQIVTAEGKVVLRFGGTVLNADRLQVNLPNFTAVGEGNIALTSGQQLVRGERFTYNFVQERGEILNARGDIYLPTTGLDFAGTLPTDVTAGIPLQPLQQVTSPGGFGFTVGSTRNVGNIPLPEEGGDIKRVRFEAERVDLNPEGWQARNVSLTNDPFSPPELELRANTVTLTRETPLRTRIKTTRQRLVFNQGLSVPIPVSERVIDRNQRDVSPAIAQFGYDDGDRGGIFVERGFTPIDTEQVRLRLTPQFFLQKAVLESGGNVFDPELYGLRSRLNADLGQRTSLRGSAIFTSLDLNDVENNLRASLRLRQLIGNRLPHNLTVEYSYRDRLYNGTLGYQTVQSSIGGILTSPAIPLGNTGINLSYQAGAQYVSADTDRAELLEPVRENNRVSLSRFQGTAALSRGFLLWQGQPLPSTATAALRYSPVPVVPYLLLFAGLTGTSSFYSSGDTQTLLSGTVGLQGQLGRFSRPLLDYTSFNISYSQGIISGLSPFLFDRTADTRVLGAGLTQQIYGPFRFGVQTYVNLDTREQISTDYVVEYSRRTYGVTLRYNPSLELGSLSLRISDFNWSGGSNPFSDSEIRPVLGGVRREND